MTRKEFEMYLSSLQFTSFTPSFVTLHHTASPSLAQRPHGFTQQHLLNLLDYYQNTMGWNGGPHVFIDDQEDGIIVFQRMDRRGVHAVSFNKNSWGVEMLGYYDHEDFDSGRGKTVRDNAMQALAIMCKHIGVKANTIKFHRDDPKTTKTCPGTKVSKAYVTHAVEVLLGSPSTTENAVDYSHWTVIMPDGSTWSNPHVTNGSVTAKAKDFLTALKPGSTLALGNNNTLNWKIGPQNIVLNVAEIDEDNRSWVSIRQTCEAVGYKLDIDTQTIHIRS